MEQRGREKKAHDLFKRFAGNPILMAEHWPYPANAVFNPAAAKLGNETLLLARVEDMRGFSHLTVARSPNGFTDWQIDAEPTLTADPHSNEERWGLEDARIVWLEEQKEFAVTYVSFSEGGPLVSLAITKNFKTFARLGALLPPEDKDACLFPRRFDGRFALIHHPIFRGEAHIWLSFSPDLKHWGDHQLLIHTRPAYWDTHRIGLALADLNQPGKLLHRSAEWVLGPQAYYERVGGVGDVVFPTGVIVERETDELRLYYGAADCTIAVATAKFSEVLDYALPPAPSPIIDRLEPAAAPWDRLRHIAARRCLPDLKPLLARQRKPARFDGFADARDVARAQHHDELGGMFEDPGQGDLVRVSPAEAVTDPTENLPQTYRLLRLLMEQSAAAEGRPRHRPDAKLLTLVERPIDVGGQMHHRVLNLIRHKRNSQPGGKQLELGRQEVGDAEVPHHAAILQRDERVVDFVRIHQRIGAMDQQQIDVVGAQILQRPLDGLPDVRGACVV